MSDFAWRMLLMVAYTAVAVRAAWNLRCAKDIRGKLASVAIATVAGLWAGLWLYCAIEYGFDALIGVAHVSFGVWLGRVIHIPQLVAMLFVMKLTCRNGERYR